jgi:hypothetical protein
MLFDRRQLLVGGGLAVAALAADAPARSAPTESRTRAAPRLRLNANENPCGPSPAARRAIQAALGDGNRYARNAADLEALIARREGLTPAHVILTPGSQALRALLLATEARWQMLRYQVNPHFLFNALNSSRALVDEEPGRARQMITELADFFRYSLLETQARDVPLGDELRAIRSYLEIQRIRFEERLCVSFDVEPRAEEVRLPGFLIHPLVENAVKHGLDTQKGRVELRIRAALVGDRLEVEVANTGRWLAAREPGVAGTGTGLANVRERLAHAFPGRHRFELREDAGWVRASLSVEPGRREAA